MQTPDPITALIAALTDDQLEALAVRLAPVLAPIIQSAAAGVDAPAPRTSPFASVDEAAAYLNMTRRSVPQHNDRQIATSLWPQRPRRQQAGKHAGKQRKSIGKENYCDVFLHRIELRRLEKLWYPRRSLVFGLWALARF